MICMKFPNVLIINSSLISTVVDLQLINLLHNYLLIKMLISTLKNLQHINYQKFTNMNYKVKIDY
jgi:hypothetical protein